MADSKMYYNFPITADKQIRIASNQFGSKEVVFLSRGFPDFPISKTIFYKLRNLIDYIDEGWAEIAAGNKPPPQILVHSINRATGGRNEWLLRFIKMKQYVFTHLLSSIQ
jgi:hypothetical protein